MNKTFASLRIATAALGLGLASTGTAFATGSLQCEGTPYAAEVQFQLSSGELTALVIARTDRAQPTSERFTLQHRFVDYPRQRMRITATGLETPRRTATLSISKTRGTLTYGGVQRRLRCDWNYLG